MLTLHDIATVIRSMNDDGIMEGVNLKQWSEDHDGITMPDGEDYDVLDDVDKEDLETISNFLVNKAGLAPDPDHETRAGYAQRMMSTTLAFHLGLAVGAEARRNYGYVHKPYPDVSMGAGGMSGNPNLFMPEESEGTTDMTAFEDVLTSFDDEE